MPADAFRLLATAIVPVVAIRTVGKLMVLSPRTSSLPKLLLKPGRWTVGSAATCSYQIEATGVQPRHALLLCGGQRTLLKAWDARTWHNGQPVRGEVPLQLGDRVTIGSVEFTMDADETSDVLAMRPDAPCEVDTKIPQPCRPGPCGLDDSKQKQDRPSHKGSGYSESENPAQLPTTTSPEPDGWDLDHLRDQIQELRDELSQRVNRRSAVIPIPASPIEHAAPPITARVSELEQAAVAARQLAEQTQQELAVMRVEQAQREAEWQRDREQLRAEAVRFADVSEQQAAAWDVEREQWQEELLSLANARQQSSMEWEQRQSALQAEALRWQTECEQQRSAWQQQTTSVAEQTRSLEELLRQADAAQQAAAQRERELNEQSQRLFEERQQLDAERQQLQTERLASEQALVELSAERQHVEQHAAEVLHKFEDFTRRMAEFEQQQTQVTRDQQVLEHSWNWLQGDRRKLVEEKDKLVEEKEQWQQQRSDWQAEYQRWDAEREQFQQERDEFAMSRELWRGQRDTTQQLMADREQLAAERAEWQRQREQAESELRDGVEQLETVRAELQSQQQAINDERDQLQTLRSEAVTHTAEIERDVQATPVERQTLFDECLAWDQARAELVVTSPETQPTKPSPFDAPLESLTGDWYIGVDLTAPRLPHADESTFESETTENWPSVDSSAPLDESNSPPFVSQLDNASETTPPMPEETTWDTPPETSSEVPTPVLNTPVSAAKDLSDSAANELRAQLAEMFHLPGLRETIPETVVSDEPVAQELPEPEPIIAPPPAEFITPEPPSPEPEPAPEPSVSSQEALAFSEEEDVDDSVSRYMQHLLARSNHHGTNSFERSASSNEMKTGATHLPVATAASSGSSPFAVTEVDVPVDSKTQEIESPSRINLPTEPVHKQNKDAVRVATEHMRQLANQQTLKNVQASNWSRLKRSIKTKSCLAAFSFVLSAGLMILGYYYKPDFMVLGICASGLGVMTWVDLFIAIRDARSRTSQLSGRKKKA